MWMFINTIQVILMALWSMICILTAIIFRFITFNTKISLFIARNIYGPGIMLICGIRIKVSGQENVPVEESSVFLSNHISYLDIPALYASIKANLYFIARQEVKSVPFFGWFMSTMDMVFLDFKRPRKSVQSINKAANMVRNGKDVIGFPEGGRKPGSAIHTFKKGVFMLAHKAKAKIVPIVMFGSDKLVARDKMKIRPGSISLHIGKPVDSTLFETPLALKEEVFEIMTRMHNELKVSYESNFS